MTSQVTIIGAGMIGLTLANLLAQAGIHVVVMERQLPTFAEGQQAHDIFPARVSALNLSSRDVLKKIGAWDRIRPQYVSGFSEIEAWARHIESAIHFDAATLAHRYLGYILDNRELVRVLWEMAELNKYITLQCPVQLTALSDIQSSELIIGADGAESWVRQQVGIDCCQRSYGQHALVATLTTGRPHHGKARQRFLKTGPIGVLPLHDPHQVSIVWSADDDYAGNLMALDDKAFNRALSNALDLELGKMTLLTKRMLFPLVMRHAKQYVKSNVVLVGDAAHTIHPLAGQGANLGFKDIVELSNQLITVHAKRYDLNNLRALRVYERHRRADNTVMHAAMLAFRLAKQPLGFSLIDKHDTLKRLFVSFLEA